MHLVDESSTSEIEIIDAEDGEEVGTKEDNPQLADAMAKVLRMSGKRILSKAKLLTDVKEGSKLKLEYDFEVEGEEEKTDVDVKPEVDDIKPSKKLFNPSKVMKKDKLNRGRLKPSVLDKEKEKPLVKIATKGVIQLFNAVKQQQTKINSQMSESGLTEVKKDKILKSIDKNAFLKVLMGSKAKDNPDADVKSEDVIKSEKESESDEESHKKGEPSWQVLRSDFMMGAKLKDWDKKEDVDSSEPPPKTRKRSVK